MCCLPNSSFCTHCVQHWNEVLQLSLVQTAQQLEVRQQLIDIDLGKDRKQGLQHRGVQLQQGLQQWAQLVFRDSVKKVEEGGQAAGRDAAQEGQEGLQLAGGHAAQEVQQLGQLVWVLTSNLWGGAGAGVCWNCQGS